jgi:hypothetical protein
VSEIPTFHKGRRNFGTGYDMMSRIEALEAALDEIIMEATSRNHAIDIARRARHGYDKKISPDAK